jgi:hypothetical protein
VKEEGRRKKEEGRRKKEEGIGNWELGRALVMWESTKKVNARKLAVSVIRYILSDRECSCYVIIGRSNYLWLQKCRAIIDLYLLILVHGGGLRLCSSGFNRLISTA